MSVEAYLVTSGKLASVGQIATTHGWGDFVRWVDTLDLDTYPELIHLAEHGWEGQLADVESQLAAALAASPPAPSVLSTANGLLQKLKARGAAGAIKISAGEE